MAAMSREDSSLQTGTVLAGPKAVSPCSCEHSAYMYNILFGILFCFCVLPLMTGLFVCPPRFQRSSVSEVLNGQPDKGSPRAGRIRFDCVPPKPNLTSLHCNLAPSSAGLAPRAMFCLSSSGQSRSKLRIAGNTPQHVLLVSM